MVIDDLHPGRLKVSDSPYDTKVAGVVSGAGSLGPGAILQHGLAEPTESMVALSGRVYCKAETLSSPIEPGDLLTISSKPGHAMKAIEPAMAHGAVLGKSNDAAAYSRRARPGDRHSTMRSRDATASD
jgi:hypothetical protein